MTATPWELLLNGSMIQAAYETYNQAFAVSGIVGLPIGILYLVFMILLFIQSRNIAFHFVVSLFLFAAIYVWIPPIIKGIIITILILELGGVIYVWATKEN